MLRTTRVHYAYLISIDDVMLVYIAVSVYIVALHMHKCEVRRVWVIIDQDTPCSTTWLRFCVCLKSQYAEEFTKNLLLICF